MPANYAHYRFGQQLRKALPAPVQRTIGRFPQLFDVGLHGPDLFFYFNPFVKSAAGDLGKRYHRMTGEECFTAACAALKANPSEAGMVYLYGLLAHYCLDSHCHPFVNRTAAEGEVSHVEIEVEFDRFLLYTDGKRPPHTQDISRHMKLTRGECVTVAQFYPPATAANVHASVTHMARSTRFLAQKNRKLLKRLLSVTPKSIQDQQMQSPANHRSLHLNEPLLALYNQALEAYPDMLSSLTAYFEEGTPFGELFQKDFG